MLGFFDSGCGGLTILKACRELLPKFDYLYLGDNRRFPYGDHAQEEIYQFTIQGVETLFERGAKLVILACNTASAIALRRLQTEWLPQTEPTKRVLGVLVPTIEQITGLTWHETAPARPHHQEKGVGILATLATVTSNSYLSEIKKRAPKLPVFQQACPGLVQAIEQQGQTDLNHLVTKYVSQLLDQGEISSCLLGCTHYDLIADQIAAALPANVRLYRQPQVVAQSLKNYLQRHPELIAPTRNEGGIDFLTTGNATEVNQSCRAYFGQDVSFLTV